MSAAGALVRATRLAGADRRRLWLSLALGVVAAGAAIGLLVTSGYLISAAALEPPILTLTVAIVGVRTFAVLRATSRYAERLSSHDVALRVLADTRRRLYDRLVPLVPGGLPRLRGGDLLSRAIADVDSLQHLYVRALGPPVVAAIVCALAVAVGWIMLPAAGIALAVVLGAAAIALPVMSAAAGRRAGRRQAPARAALTAEVLEAIQLAPELAAYGLEDDRIDRVRADDRRLMRTGRSDAAIGATGTGVVTALGGIAAAIVLAVSIPAVVSGELDGVLLAALALLALAAVDTLAPLPVAAQHLSATATAMERLEEITERPAPVADPADPVPVGPRPALALAGARLRYSPDGPWVLDGVDLRLEPGRRVAVVGPSGAGKSTIANALVRFRDLDGGALPDRRDRRAPPRPGRHPPRGAPVRAGRPSVRHRHPRERPHRRPGGRRRRAWRTPWRGRAWASGWRACPTDWTPRWARPARRSPGASAAASPWPGPSSRGRPS